MDKKTKLRILSKLGLLLVFIGFFLPISCNLNGFEIARALQTLGVINPLSISLYAIFIFSCIGLFLFVLLLMKIDYNKHFDGYINLIIIAAIVFFIYNYNKEQNESILNSLFRFQIGAYVILSGIIISTISIFMISEDNIEETKNIDNNDVKIGNQWICEKCGNVNNISLLICTNCGKEYNKKYELYKYLNEENNSEEQNIIEVKYKNNFCVNCGNKLQEGIKFCTNCGNKI